MRVHEVKTQGACVSTLTMGEGPDVLLIHGLGGAKSSFFDTASALSSRYRVHALDLPGFGSSSKPSLAPYNAKYFAKVVVDVMDALGIEKAHLVGNSMGGRVSIEVGLRYPERVHGLALLCPAVAFIKREFHPIVRLLRPEFGMLPHRFTRGMIAGQFWSMFCDRDAVDPSVADVVVEEFQRIYASAGARFAFLASARNIYLDNPFGRGGFYPRLSELTAPSLFVWGTHDPLIPHGFKRHVERWLPRADQVVLESCGHVPQVERARRERTTCSAGSSQARPRAPRPPRRRGVARVASGHGGTTTRPRQRARPRRRRSRQAPASPPRSGGGRRLPARRLARASAGRSPRDPAADLDDRDPDYIRESLPALWLLVGCTSAARSAGSGNVPEDGPVLLVGNHSGGNLTVDTGVFTLAFSAYFGVERALTRSRTTSSSRCPASASCAGSASSPPRRRTRARRSRPTPAVLVYPGGDVEVHRPVWQRNTVDFDGRKGWIRLALEQDVPIVPVVSIGGQETALFLSAGETLGQAAAARQDRAPEGAAGLDLAPWGINVGDFLGHVPLPAKITVETLPPIHLREEFGDDPDLDEVYEHVTRLMQETLDALAAERRWPIIG
jgi:pimeloyl-ACP methyl ester carboxylesterase/1-acyl-sn-glycerol-3-phosphate acyltransferase